MVETHSVAAGAQLVVAVLVVPAVIRPVLQIGSIRHTVTAGLE
jgi:hypothetical protein